MAAGDVPEVGESAGRDLPHGDAGQAEDEVVLDHEDRDGGRQSVRLVKPQPAELRSRPRRGRERLTRHAEGLFHAEVLTDPAGLLGGAIVQPGQARAHGRAPPIQQDERLGLSGERDGRLVPARKTRDGRALPDQLQHGGEELFRIELDANPLAGVDGRRRGGREPAQLLVVEHHFQVRGADVDRVDEHRQPARIWRWTVRVRGRTESRSPK